MPRTNTGSGLGLPAGGLDTGDEERDGALLRLRPILQDGEEAAGRLGQHDGGDVVRAWRLPERRTKLLRRPGAGSHEEQGRPEERRQAGPAQSQLTRTALDRKSTRLNSSHVAI